MGGGQSQEQAQRLLNQGRAKLRTFVHKGTVQPITATQDVHVKRKSMFQQIVSRSASAMGAPLVEDRRDSLVSEQSTASLEEYVSPMLLQQLNEVASDVRASVPGGQSLIWAGLARDLGNPRRYATVALDASTRASVSSRLRSRDVGTNPFQLCFSAIICALTGEEC